MYPSLCHLFFASGTTVGLELPDSVSSHVGESACPPREKNIDVTEVAAVEGQTDLNALCGTPLPQFEEIFGSRTTVRAPKRGNCLLYF